MANAPETAVLIVGAGPVGMTLALDLAWRGVEVIIAERNGRDHRPGVRCNHIAARSLEFYRRLGLVADIREAGLPGDFPHDVAYVTTLTGYELTRIRIPCRNERYHGLGYADSGWPTPEPPHRCNQMFFEPVLQRHVLRSPRIRVLYDTQIDDFVQDDDGVTARGHDVRTGEAVEVRARYLVGCDGGSSLVRKKIGARFEGVEVISRTRMVLVRSKELLRRIGREPAWMTWFANPRAFFGAVVAIDGRELWAFHLWVPPDAPDFDVVDRDEGVRNVFGGDFEYEIVFTDDWTGRRLVADKFRDRRAFICGDAAHIWVPFAGYGMNAGIADAMNLSWQLAAVINGWGAPRLLDAYEAERQPVTDQVSRTAMAIALGNLNSETVKAPPAELEADTPEGEAVRARAGQRIYEMNLGQFACIGLNFGTHHERSPITAYDGEPAPAYDLSTYVPATVPGCRTPHLWLRDGSSLYDRMGPEYTLLRFDPATDVSGLLGAAARRGLPLHLLDLDPAEAGGIYRHTLVLSRPDQHIAWRGNTEPADPLALVDLVRGAAEKSCDAF